MREGSEIVERGLGHDEGGGLRRDAEVVPERYGPWKTLYERFRRWSADGNAPATTKPWSPSPAYECGCPDFADTA